MKRVLLGSDDGANADELYLDFKEGNFFSIFEISLSFVQWMGWTKIIVHVWSLEGVRALNIRFFYI